MMGESQVQQDALFYEFSLERHVPGDHLLRAIDRFVELDGVRAHLVPFYSETGRPSIDPELLIRMLIVGYCFGHPLGTAAVRRGPPEPGVSLVLPVGT
jgi:transposase